ncbi:MAG: hypothetical protein OXT67_08960 [Zetaproteobacteria bacterium]|nr:hypothetical protein [Zetaproteobacteria bacterium]
MNTWRVVVIVSGTSIGAGMLALPSVTAEAGFGLALVGQMFIYLMALCSGLYLADACCWMKGDSIHMASVGKHYLGRWGQFGVLIAFLFLYNCLLISYFSGLYPLVGHVGASLGGPTEDHFSYMILLACTVGLLLYAGVEAVTSVSTLFMLGLVLSFVWMIFGSLQDVSWSYLRHTRLDAFSLMLPTLLGAFGYHNVVPSVVQRFQGTRVQLYRALSVGLLGPFVIYILWQYVVLGVLPYTQIAQFNQAAAGVPLVAALQGASQDNSLVLLMPWFTFFAIITSIIGVGLSLIDFLHDLFASYHFRAGRYIYVLLTVVPSALIGYFYPNLFMKLFAYAAGIGEGLLNIIFPTVCVICGLYVRGEHSALPRWMTHPISFAVIILSSFWIMVLSI